MKRDEMIKWSDIIAKKTAELVIQQLNGSASKNDDEYVDCKEAARILDVTPNYLRAMKHKFPHKKVGNHSQGRILFKKSELLENYVK